MTVQGVMYRTSNVVAHVRVERARITSDVRLGRQAQLPSERGRLDLFAQAVCSPAQHEEAVAHEPEMRARLRCELLVALTARQAEVAQEGCCARDVRTRCRTSKPH